MRLQARSGDRLAADTLQLHVAMLNDRRRTSSYLSAVREMVRPGDVVVDIGTGTGVLAIAAAQAGARRVYAIEAGGIAVWAERLIEANGFSETIRPIRALSTETVLPERADVVVSELIGDEPLSERVVGITKHALRHLARPAARLVPSGVVLHALLVSVPDHELARLVFTRDTLRRWRQAYGMEFDPLEEVTPFRTFNYFINPHQMRGWTFLSDPVPLEAVDLRTWRRPSVRSRRTVRATASGQLNAVVTFFTLVAGARTFFSTHPAQVDEDNHWNSPVRVVWPPLEVREGDTVELDYWYGLRPALSACRVSLLDSEPAATWTP